MHNFFPFVPNIVPLFQYTILFSSALLYCHFLISFLLCWHAAIIINYEICQLAVLFISLSIFSACCCCVLYGLSSCFLFHVDGSHCIIIFYVRLSLMPLFPTYIRVPSKILEVLDSTWQICYSVVEPKPSTDRWWGRFSLMTFVFYAHLGPFMNLYTSAQTICMSFCPVCEHDLS